MHKTAQKPSIKSTAKTSGRCSNFCSSPTSASHIFVLVLRLHRATFVLLTCAFSRSIFVIAKTFYMKKKFTLATSFTICILAAIQTVVAQTNIFPATGAAGIGTLTPNASSLLDITSTTKGILIPRMTQSQRNAIVGPATGLMIYQTTNTPGFYYYSGTSWTAISSKGANAALSNLKAPTAVNQSLIPG
jgi:hypothetical protein